MSEEIQKLEAELEELGKSLKPQHLAFANNLIDGMSQAEAYENAGYKARGKAAEQAASRLLSSNVKLKEYIDLVKEIAIKSSKDELIATTDQKRRLLWDIAQTCAAKVTVPVKGTEDEEGEAQVEVLGIVDAKPAISAIAELNKMDGDLAAVKQHVGLDEGNPLTALMQQIAGKAQEEGPVRGGNSNT